MSELRFRDDKGRFASQEEENAYMNSLFKSMVGTPLTSAPATAPTSGTGQPVPPGAGPDLPEESENDVMNRAFMEMAGVVDPKSR